MKVKYVLIACVVGLYSFPAMASDCSINADTMDLIVAKFQALVDGKINQTIAVATAASDPNESQRKTLWTNWGADQGPQNVGQELDAFKKYLLDLKKDRCMEKK